MTDENMIKLIGNAIRGLTLDAVDKAQSGHVGLPLGCAEIVTLLYNDILKHYPKQPKWIDRDRFVLSAGHGSMLLYSILHLSGYNISKNDIENFRQMDSKTPGHPEYNAELGVEVTTGPLGQGISNAVGMAIAEKMMAEKYNTKEYQIINHYTYCLAGDGCLMEGISSEAISLAGHLGLSKLILIYDDNDISIDGKTDITFTEDIKRKFEANNWHTQNVNGYDHNGFYKALINAKENIDKPSIIITQTIPGKGLTKYEGSHKSHGNPMNHDDVVEFREKNEIPNSFYVPNEIYQFYSGKLKELEYKYNIWEIDYKKWRDDNTQLAKDFDLAINGKLNLIKDNLIEKEYGKKIATRASSGEVINKVSEKAFFLIGGSADLASSNKVTINNSGFIKNRDFNNRNIHFGVREHAMGGIVNGINLHKGFRAFASTFLVFSDYMRPAIRLACLMDLPTIFIFTHDSFQVGEDGPTHQPVEHVQSLRDIPNLIVIRPSDAFEVEEAWKFILNNNSEPISLILSRQKLENINREKYKDAIGLHKGAYIIKEANKDTPDMIIFATGSEVKDAIDASEILENKYAIKIQVVSMPSQEIFEKQDDSYKNMIIPSHVKRVISIEAGITNGWYKYVGDNGLTIGISSFGKSAPGNELKEYFGFTCQKIVEKIETHYKM